MTISMTMLLIIIGCGLVTLIPRIAPFILAKKVDMPDVVKQWLSYIPVCILTALIVQGIWTEQQQGTLVWNWGYMLALVPTFIVAIWTKSLSYTVIVGVLSMALIRLFI